METTAMTKPLTELTFYDLRKQTNRLAKKTYDLNRETARRFLVERYGTETPELKTYQSYVTLSVPLTVYAKDEADAKELINDHVYIEIGHPAAMWIASIPGTLIELDDMQTLDIDELEEKTEEEPLAA
jgi:hypothetical protein